MTEPWAIDYIAVVGGRTERGNLQGFLEETLPWEWLDAYARCTPHEVNVHRFQGGDG